MNAILTIIYFALTLAVLLFLGVPLYWLARKFHRFWWWSIVWLMFMPLTLLWTYQVASSLQFSASRPVPKQRGVAPGGGGPSVFQGVARRAGVSANAALALLIGVVPSIVLLWWHPLRSRCQPFRPRHAMGFAGLITAVAMMFYPGMRWIDAHGQTGTNTELHWQRYGFALSKYPDGRPSHLEFTGWDAGTQVAFDRQVISQIAEMRSLRQLRLRKAGITDDDLLKLVELTELTELIVDDNPLTDGCLPALREFKKLKHLNISGTQITDACVPVLLDMPRLQSTWFPKTMSQVGKKTVNRHVDRILLQAHGDENK